MKTIFTIVSFLFTLPAFAIESTATNEKCKNKDSKPEEEVRTTLPAQLNYYEEDAIKAESLDLAPPKITSGNPVPVDTANSSISKYNYLFYFIYKYKYENKLGIGQIERLITD